MGTSFHAVPWLEARPPLRAQVELRRLGERFGTPRSAGKPRQFWLRLSWRFSHRSRRSRLCNSRAVTPERGSPQLRRPGRPAIGPARDLERTAAEQPRAAHCSTLERPRAGSIGDGLSLRHRLAASWLAEGRLSASEVAARLGYASASWSLDPARAMRMRHPSPAARAIRTNPAPTTMAPVARATSSPAGARRSMVMAAATTAMARRSMTPMTRRIAISPAQQ